jgi:CheY-like chemotaxis protein
VGNKRQRLELYYSDRYSNAAASTIGRVDGTVDTSYQMVSLEQILIVERDEAAVTLYKRALRGRFEITTVTDSLAGLELLRHEQEFPLVIADYDAPYLSGPEFFAEALELRPNLVPILTARAERGTEALAAVNQQNLFRLLVKPCLATDLTKAVDDAIKQHELLTAGRRALTEMSTRLVHVLSELLRHVRPAAFDKGARLQELVRLLSAQFPRQESWQLEATAMLSQFGFLGVSDVANDRLESGAPLTADEQEEVDAQIGIAAKLLSDIDVLGPIVEDLKCLAAAVASRGASQATRGMRPDGARLVEVLIEYDELIESGYSDTQVLTKLYSGDRNYDQDILSVLEETLVSVGDGQTFRMLTLDELQNGMVVREGIRAKNGNLVTGKDTILTTPILLKIRNFANYHELIEPVAVLVPDHVSIV